MSTQENADPARYRRIIVPRHGGPEVLQVVEEEVSEPGPGEVRLKVLAAGVSTFDLMLRCSGSTPGTPRLPHTPGLDVVGVVDKLGDGVDGLEPGQVVAGYALGGGYAEYICLPDWHLVPVPEALDPAQAVCVVVNYLTAHMVLHEALRVRKGERMLVHGAAGGVGSAAVELGRLAGLEMYGTASRHNHDFVTSLGATPIDYRNEDFVVRIHELTGDGVDVVIDPVGGPGQLRRSYLALRKGGRLMLFGMASLTRRGVRMIPLSIAMIGLLKLVPDGRHASTSPDLSVFARKHRDWYRNTLAWLLEAVAEGRLRPTVAERVPLTEAVRAHEILERGGHTGKLVLVTGQ